MIIKKEYIWILILLILGYIVLNFGNFKIKENVTSPEIYFRNINKNNIINISKYICPTEYLLTTSKDQMDYKDINDLYLCIRKNGFSIVDIANENVFYNSTGSVDDFFRNSYDFKEISYDEYQFVSDIEKDNNSWNNCLNIINNSMIDNKIVRYEYNAIITCLESVREKNEIGLKENVIVDLKQKIGK